jgi:3'-5' exoribonuclease
MAATQIADFEVGRPVEGVFAVVAKQRRTSRAGDPFLILQLSDASGRIDARVWDNAEYFDRNVAAGDTVSVVGKTSMFRDQMQLDVRRLERAQGQFAESFVPTATRNLDELSGELDFLVGEIRCDDLRRLVDAVWSGPLREQLLRSPATVADHHAYLGGLAEHTLAVTGMALAACDRHEQVDRDLVLAAALLHDVGRAREIQVGQQISADPEGSLYGHVLLGHELMLEAAGRTLGSVDAIAWWPALVHAVSTHHGPLERCRTREATIVASANALDVRLSAAAR